MNNFGYQSSFNSLHHRNPHFTPSIDRISFQNYKPSKANSSMETEHLRKSVEDVEMYPSGFAELLRNQDRNIKSFKNKVSKEKERINHDISSFKIQFTHNIEDLRLSLHAELDRIYQNYLERYAQFKGQLLQINRLKEQMEMQIAMGRTIPRKHGEKKLTSSNAKTISNMEYGNQELKKFHVMNYISELQKQRILPLKDYLREIIVLTEYQNGFYQSETFQKVLERLKEQLNSDLRNIYSNKYEYIRDVDSLTFKETSKILDEVLEDGPQYKSNIQTAPIKRTYLSRAPQSGSLGPSQQTAKFEWTEKVKLREERQVKCFDQILCGTVINDILIFGSKSGKIHLFGKDGSQLGVLKDHQASICTLSSMKVRNKTYLMSGSDHGCSTVVIWDVEKQKLVTKFKQHSAAVTALLDLEDNTHILSGSYDKKINIYNLDSESFVYTLPTNKTSITGAILSSDSSKMISCGLDKALSVWEIHRGNERKVQTLSMMKKIQSSCLVCSMVPSQINPEIIIIGDKEGKIKIINVANGQAVKTINCSNNYLIELILIERSSKPNYPIILAWPYKEQRILMINSENEMVESKNTKGFLEYGCGISPKCFLVDGGHALWTVSHSQGHPETISYRIDDSM